MVDGVVTGQSESRTVGLKHAVARPALPVLGGTGLEYLKVLDLRYEHNSGVCDLFSIPCAQLAVQVSSMLRGPTETDCL